METKKVLSIDIGIVNLGYVYCEITDKSINVLECNRVDITYMRHNRVNLCDCKLHHDTVIPDYLDHFIQETKLFEDADLILVERQPPQGLQSLQELIFTRFRHKVKLINPNSIHKYFKMTKGDYDVRKIESVNHANKFLETFTNFQINERKHDMSDAMLMVEYYFETSKIKKKEPVKITKVNHLETFKINFNPIEYFDQFKYIKSV